MEIAELNALLTPEGLRLLDSLGETTAASDVARIVSQLRGAGHPPELVSAVVGQARLRAKASAKFGPFAERMLFTRAGLEQATRLEVAAHHAGRLRGAGATRVADLGCGIGGDALGFAGIGLDVLAVDADEVTAALAAYNLAPFGDAVSVAHARAEEADLTGVDAVWLDPARRTAGHSETTRVSAADYSPSLDWAFALASRIPAGIKLGPAFDRGEIPDDMEAQWISVDGSTVELVLWSGPLARDGVRRAALVIRGGQAHELTAPADSEDVGTRTWQWGTNADSPWGEYLYEPEGAIIRARLIGEVARSLDAAMLSEGIAYLTGDSPDGGPFTRTFRIREALPLQKNAINASLDVNDIGIIEIKKRGVDIDPAQFRKKLHLKGTESATLFLTRVGGKRVALLADRV